MTVRRKRSRILVAYPLLCLLISLMSTSCGHASAQEPGLTRTRDELTQARNQVRPYADSLAAALGHSRFLLAPTVFGAYRSCLTGKNRVDYVYTITVRANGPAAIAELSREVTTLLHAEGWQVVSVDYSKTHIVLADTNHPLYSMRQREMKGAANILPYGNSSAGAIIFMHSPCIDAGSLAARFVHGGKA